MTDDKTESTGLRLATDLGPLVVFLAAYWWFDDIIAATIAFMIAITAAIVAQLVVYRRVAPLLLFSGVMVLVLGGLTVWLHDEAFIKIKPTIYYGTVAVLLGFGALTGRPLLKSVLGNVYPELGDRGWAILGRNFALFFVGMAVLNELVWRNSSTEFWLGFKLWGAFPLTLVFGLANVPTIIRHSRPAAGAEPPVPPQG